MIERHLAGRRAPAIVISDERGQLLETGGGVVKALPLLGPAPFFHINSDTIWIDGVKPNLVRLAEAFDPDRMDALLLLAPTTTSIGYGGRGDYTMAPDGRLERRGERDVVPFVYAGAAIFSPDAVRRRAGRPRSRSRACSIAPRRRTPARPAPRGGVDACRHARGHRGGGSRPGGPRGVTFERSRALWPTHSSG